MDDHAIRIFISVAENGSFSKAGEQGYISKQAMLKKINALEDEVGCRLLNRGRTGTTLTPAGEVFLEGIRKIMQEKEHLIQNCRDIEGKSSVIRVGNVEHQALLVRVNMAFAVRYPDIRIEYVVHPNHSGEWRVANGVQDVAETFYSSYIADLTAHSSVGYTPLTVTHYLAAMRKNHPLCLCGKVSLRDLSRFPTMIFPVMIGPEYTLEFEKAFMSHPDYLIERSDVDNQVPAAYECLKSDKIMVTANPFIHSIQELALVPLDKSWTREYGILYQKPMTPPVRKYVELAKELYA